MRLRYFDTGYFYVENPQTVHGRDTKDLIVLHETVSGDVPGLNDIKEVEVYLTEKKYGIHGMTDKDGNIAWAAGFGNAVFWQAGGVNERSIGIEQVFKATKDIPANYELWQARMKELTATSKLLAAISNTWKIPLVFSKGDTPGVTSHWNVAKIYPASEGHWDCHPRHEGGYFPILHVINQARFFKRIPHYTLT